MRRRDRSQQERDEPLEVRMHPARQARLQWESMRRCDHVIGQDKRCTECVGHMDSIATQGHWLAERQRIGARNQ